MRIFSLMLVLSIFFYLENKAYLWIIIELAILGLNKKLLDLEKDFLFMDKYAIPKTKPVQKCTPLIC